MELHRGNVVLLKRPLADFVCVVSGFEGDKLRIRYIDSPPEDKGVIVGIDDVIKLADVQEKELPTQFLTAIEKQRQVVFAPKKERKSSVKLGDVSDETYAEILKILNEDGKEAE